MNDAPATSAAEALFGSDARDAGTPDMLRAELVTELDGAFLSARLWGLACRAYALAVQAHWTELGRFHEASGQPCAAAECRELAEELMQIAAWEMPSAATHDDSADQAIAAE